MARLQEVVAGRYELLDVLGRGGMGVVYGASDRVLDRTVALKVLPVDRADDPTSVARFEREALAAAALNHAHIVAVFDSSADGPTRYIVMEYVAGESLARLVRRRGRLPAQDAARIAAQIASALAAAHRAGIVHRDIKPANVMLDEDGTVKVLDFGIARAAAGTSITQTAIVLGSAPYLAPEVSQGESADARSDIYSLGCVLYELLTGSPPFTGELPAAVLHQHNSAIPRAPKELDPALPAGLDALVMQMLAKRPDQRPQHAEELVRGLPASIGDHPADGGEVGCPPGGVLSEPIGIRRRWARLGRVGQLGLGLAAMLVIAGLGIGVLQPSASPHDASAAHGGRSQSGGVGKHSNEHPRTVAGAARALTRLTTEDLQAGQINQPAAQEILGHLQDTLNAYAHRHITHAIRHLSSLSSKIGELTSHGDIKSAALPAISAAIADLRSGLERATPPATTTPAPPPTTTSAPTRAAPTPPAGPHRPHGDGRAPKPGHPPKGRGDPEAKPPHG